MTESLKPLPEGSTMCIRHCAICLESLGACKYTFTPLRGADVFGDDADLSHDVEEAQRQPTRHPSMCIQLEQCIKAMSESMDEL